MPPILRVSESYLDWFGKLFGRGIGLSQGFCVHRVTQIRKHGQSGIRKHNPNVRAVEDSIFLKPRGLWDQQSRTVLKLMNLHNCLQTKCLLFDSKYGAGSFFSSPLPDQHWGAPSLASSGHRS
jgi:hypothetical protein